MITRPRELAEIYEYFLSYACLVSGHCPEISPEIHPQTPAFRRFCAVLAGFFSTFHGVFAPIFRWLVRAKRAKYLYETERNHWTQDT